MNRLFRLGKLRLRYLNRPIWRRSAPSSSAKGQQADQQPPSDRPSLSLSLSAGSVPASTSSPSKTPSPSESAEIEDCTDLVTDMTQIIRYRGSTAYFSRWPPCKSAKDVSLGRFRRNTYAIGRRLSQQTTPLREQDGSLTANNSESVVYGTLIPRSGPGRFSRCPSMFFPQHRTCPLLSTAHANGEPTSIRIASLNPGTGAGSGSWKFQQTTCPLRRTAHRRPASAAMKVASLSEGTCWAGSVGLPQQTTRPLLNRAHPPVSTAT